MPSPSQGPLATEAASGPTGPASSPPTFLFTDVEGSTRLWERYPDQMRSALARHDVILSTSIGEASGGIVKTTGDGMMAVFASPVAAVAAGITAQQALAAEPWLDTCAIRVRMGIHTGEADSRGGDFFGPAVNRTARIMAAGHGGQILLSETTATLVGEELPAGVSLRDLGEHRLKDLGRPEHLFQLGHATLPSEFPALSTLDLRPNNLPTETSAFVGRDPELHAIRARLDDPSIRFVTLTGPGGTGKTRLAIRAAADQIDRFAQGVYFVDLVAATDSDTVVASIVSAIGMADAADRSPLDELRRRLRGEEVLLVLDNFEQVASAAPILVELLADCPGLKLLVTSRQALRVRGEHVVQVPPLSLPADASSAISAEDLNQFEAIQLFVERARSVRPDFNLTDDNAASVADICRRLDGLPLAIELATARLNLFSPDALRDRLASSLKALGSGARDLPERQQTLRATIEWSHHLLSPAEQRLFELLSVFAGASVEAVEAVADGVGDAAGTPLDALEGLGSLIDRSLVRQVDATKGDGSPRIVMFETIKAYAAERLDAQPEFAAAAREQHAAYFVQLASDAGSASTGSDDDAIDRLSPELDNLRVAWRHSVERRDLARLDALREGIFPMYEAHSWYHSMVQVADDLLAVLAVPPDPPDRWERELALRTGRARAMTLLRGYTPDAEDAYVEALAIAKDHGTVPQQFPVLRALASFHGFRGEFDKGIEYANEILRLADAQGDVSMRVDGWFLLGAHSGFTGDLTSGLGYLDQAIATFGTAGYRPRRLRFGIDTRVACLATTGFFLWFTGRADLAVERANRAVAIATDLEHPYSLAYALYHSGFLHLWRGESELVRDRAAAARNVADASDSPIWRALATCLAGAAMSMLGRPAEGLRQIDDGLDQYGGLRTPPVFWPMIRFMQASAHVHAGTAGPGFTLIDEAIAVEGQDTIDSALFHVVRGDLSLLEPGRDVQGATASYEKAYAVATRFGESMPQLRAAARLCRLATDDNRASRLETLRAVHATITEGHGTPDLVAAAQLLDG